MIEHRKQICTVCPYFQQQGRLVTCSVNKQTLLTGWTFPDHKCPEGRWPEVAQEEKEVVKPRFDARAKVLWLPRHDPEQEAELDAKFERIPGELKWKIDAPQTMVQKAKSFVQAITSGNADDATVAKRLESCTTCPALVTENGRKFCGACGCGKWILADLDGGPAPKLRYAHLNCPLKRPGFSNSQ